MSFPICIVCKEKFESARISKLTCSLECWHIWKANYYRDRYLEFRNANRKRKREMIIEKYSISSSNIRNIEYICEECLTKFYFDYSIYEGFSNTFISSYNTTSWGAACCPHCGLVEKSICDESISETFNMTEVERKLYLSDLHRNKKYNIKHEAIYLHNIIDFITEAEMVRKMMNRIKDKGKVTQNQLNECIAVLFRKIKELK